MRKLFIIFLALLTSPRLHAHVGSPDVYYEGNAGPYHLFVTVRLPQVIPGFAEIQVRSESPGVQTIQVVLLPLTGPGANLPPAPELAQRSKENPQFFVSNLWFLDLGALRIRIQADGAKGKAELSVPVASFARQSLPMDPWLHKVLVFFFVCLTLSVAPIAGAMVRESTVPPGETPPARNKLRSRIVLVLTLIVAVVTLHLNRAWWNAVAATYVRNVNLLKPPRAETTLLDGNRLMVRPMGRLVAPRPGLEDREVKMDELIPDHGHVMHLFLIASPGMQRLWHLHPEFTDGGFAKQLPAMPAGQYEVFADILDKTGFPWTLVGRIDLPQINGQAPSGDDSAWAGAPLASPISGSTVAQLHDGTRVIWKRGDAPIKANVAAPLNFRVEAKNGTPAGDLEPYMGMAAHAEVVCSDLSVFAHIHPAGTVPMAAVYLAQAANTDQPSADTSGMAMPMAHSSSSLPPNFSFAYGFPHPGDYRMFVQIKRSGQVQTAVFDARVQ